MLAFPHEQEQVHLEQHHSTVGESQFMLDFPLVEAQAHLEQHDSTMGEI